VASLPIPFPAAGRFDVVARYNGSGAHNVSVSAPATQMVVFNDTTTSLGIDMNPSIHGGEVKLVATVRGGPVGGPHTLTPAYQGGVQFFADGALLTVLRRVGDRWVPATFVPLNNVGQAIARTRFPMGSRTIEARYLGSGNFVAKASPLVLHRTTVPANTDMALRSSRNPGYDGQEVTATATVSNRFAAGDARFVPTGTVRFRVDGVDRGTVPVNAQGKAALYLGVLPVGRHTVVATYTPDTDNHVGSGTAYYHHVRVASKLTAAVVGPATANRPFLLRVLARGADNSVVPGFNGPARIALVSAPPGGALVGPRAATMAGGKVEFTGLRVTRNATRARPYVLVITAADLDSRIVRRIVVRIGPGGRLI
jgi:hypothetical protein